MGVASSWHPAWHAEQTIDEVVYAVYVSELNEQVSNMLVCVALASFFLLGWHHHWQCKVHGFQGTRRQTQGSGESY